MSNRTLHIHNGSTLVEKWHISEHSIEWSNMSRIHVVYYPTITIIVKHWLLGYTHLEYLYMLHDFIRWINTSKIIYCKFNRWMEIEHHCRHYSVQLEHHQLYSSTISALMSNRPLHIHNGSILVEKWHISEHSIEWSNMRRIHVVYCPTITIIVKHWLLGYTHLEYLYMLHDFIRWMDTSKSYIACVTGRWRFNITVDSIVFSLNIINYTHQQ